MVTGGHGHDHARGRMLFRLGGQIVAHLTPNVRTTTGNLACLVACVSALRWAIRDPEARGRPVCIRYASESTPSTSALVFGGRRNIKLSRRKAVRSGGSSSKSLAVNCGCTTVATRAEDGPTYNRRTHLLFKDASQDGQSTST